jgi:hypothetical protein
MYLAVTAAMGMREPYDLVIHADTTYESQYTYDYVNKWEGWLSSRCNYVRVTHDRGPDLKEFMDLPFYGERGPMRRQCTGRWKIEPMRKYLRRYLKERGMSVYNGNLRGSGVSVQVDLGITLDEYARMADSDVGYIKNSFPLVDERLTRQDVTKLLEKLGIEVPAKSGCYFCPYHRKAHWAGMAKQGDLDFERACIVDEQIRKLCLPGFVYLHRDRLPLRSLDVASVQLDLFEDMMCTGSYCMY